MTKPTIATLAIQQIVADEGVQPRISIRMDEVEKYKAVIEAGGVMPPLVVYFDGTTYWLSSGFHRRKAYEMADIVEVPVEIRTGTRRDAWLDAKGSNKHGIHFTNEEKRRNVLEMLEDEECGTWSDRAIALHIGVSAPFVGELRKSSTVNIYSGGPRKDVHGRIINTGNIGKKPAANADVAISDIADDADSVFDDEEDEILNPSNSTGLESEPAEPKRVYVDPARLATIYDESAPNGFYSGDIRASYSADLIAEKKGVRKPFEHGGKLYISTSGGEGEQECHELIPASEYSGPTHDYPGKPGDGFYVGMRVKHNKKDFVLGRKVVFVARSDDSTSDDEPGMEYSGEVDGYGRPIGSTPTVNIYSEDAVAAEEKAPQLPPEQRAAALPLAQALDGFAHRGHVFRQQATLYYELEAALKKFRHAVQPAIRWTSGVFSEAVRAVCTMSPPELWEGCAACKGSRRTAEGELCPACNGQGFTTHKGEGVAPEIVATFAASADGAVDGATDDAAGSVTEDGDE